MAAVGYARVSTRDQNLDGQTDSLEVAGCEKVFVEHASGVLAKRPALEDALDYLRAGDTLVVTKLDRLGRSVRNLKEVVDGLEKRNVGLKALSQGIDTTTPAVGCSFTCSQRSQNSNTTSSSNERTKDGMAAARARGREGGGRIKMSPTKIQQARAMYDENTYTVQQIAETFGVSRGTIYRHLGENVRA